MSRTEFTALVRWESRTAARLTESGLHPVDVALTFTGLAAVMSQLAQGAMW